MRARVGIVVPGKPPAAGATVGVDRV